MILVWVLQAVKGTVRHELGAGIIGICVAITQTANNALGRTV
jgi:hypothetical protein